MFRLVVVDFGDHFELHHLTMDWDCFFWCEIDYFHYKKLIAAGVQNGY